MPDASNALDLLHNEDYEKPFDRRNLDNRGLIFERNRPRQSLNGSWSFTLDRFDTGLRQQTNGALGLRCP